MGRGAVVGGSAFFARKPHHVTVVAVTRSVIVSLSRSDLLTHAPPEALVALADHARRTVHADLEVARRSLPPHPGLSTPIRGSTAAQRYEGGGKPGHGSAPGASDGRGTAAEKDSAHSEIARLLAQSAARIAIGTPAGASSGRGSRPFAARRPRAGKRGGALPAAHGPPAAGHGPTSAALDRARRVPRWALPAPEDAPSSSAASDPRTRTSHAQAKAATVSPVAPGLDVTAAAASRAHTFTRAMQWQRSVDRDAKEGAALLERNAAPDGASPPNAGRSSPVAARWSTDGAPSPEEYHKAPPARTVSRMAVSGRMLDGGAAHAPTRVTLSAKDLPPVPAGQPRGAALTASVTKISSMRGSQPALLLHLRPQPGRCAPREWWSSLPLDSFPAADGGGEAVDAAIRERRQLAGAALREATRCVTSLWRNTCGGVALRACGGGPGCDAGPSATPSGFPLTRIPPPSPVSQTPCPPPPSETSPCGVEALCLSASRSAPVPALPWARRTSRCGPPCLPPPHTYPFFFSFPWLHDAAERAAHAFSPAPSLPPRAAGAGCVAGRHRLLRRAPGSASCAGGPSGRRGCHVDGGLHGKRGYCGHRSAVHLLGGRGRRRRRRRTPPV